MTITQKHINAKKDSVYSREELQEKYSQAKKYRQRLSGLPVNKGLRDYLVEPIAVVEDVLKDLVETEKHVMD